VHVTAVDTGFGQIAMKLRNDPRVRLLERTNARFLAAGRWKRAATNRADAAGDGRGVHLGDTAAGTGAGRGAALTEAVILVKPQFEAGRGHVGKGGIVRDPEAHQLAVDKVADCVRGLGWGVWRRSIRRLPGRKGTRSFCCTRGGEELAS